MSKSTQLSVLQEILATLQRIEMRLNADQADLTPIETAPQDTPPPSQPEAVCTDQSADVRGSCIDCINSLVNEKQRPGDVRRALDGVNAARLGDVPDWQLPELLKLFQRLLEE